MTRLLEKMRFQLSTSFLTLSFDDCCRRKHSVEDVEVTFMVKVGMTQSDLSGSTQPAVFPNLLNAAKPLSVIGCSKVARTLSVVQ